LSSGVYASAVHANWLDENGKAEIDDRTPEDLLDIIETKGREIAEALSLLKNASFQKS
jgi:hypothetical protein